VKWLTVYDGSGVADPAFVGPDAQSPQLKGADNRQFPYTYHNDLRLDPAIVAEYRAFLEQAESKGPKRVAAAVTGGALGWAWLLVLLVFLARRWVSLRSTHPTGTTGAGPFHRRVG